MRRPIIGVACEGEKANGDAEIGLPRAEALTFCGPTGTRTLRANLAPEENMLAPMAAEHRRTSESSMAAANKASPREAGRETLLKSGERYAGIARKMRMGHSEAIRPVTLAHNLGSPLHNHRTRGRR